MDLSRLRTRRGIVATLVSAAFARALPEPVRAQLNSGCEYGITNGLVTIGGDNCNLAVPQHMIDDRTNANSNSSNSTATSTNVNTNVDSPKEIRQERLRRRRDHHKTKSTRRNRQSQERSQRKQDRKILCEDFSSQLAAVEAMAQNPWAANKLDPDGDGVPCEDLRALTCGEFRNEDEATNWFNRMGYSKEYDPFKLFDAETGGVCSFRAICDDFNTIKAAIEWMHDHPADRKRLDPNDDGIACSDLTKLKCSQFDSSKEAQEWHDHYKPNGASSWDPYGLYDTAASRYCSELPATTNG